MVLAQFMRVKQLFLQPAVWLLLAVLSPPALADDLWPSEPTIAAKSWALLDVDSSQVLFSKNADEHLPPASLTKLMTLYLVFESLKKKQIQMDDQLPVSKKAWKIGGSTMFLEPRMTPRVDDLIHGVATFSGNDSCIVLAEYLSGSEEAFAERMNAKAKELGMQDSHFLNATGWPATGHYSSAHDMALLGAALWRDFPEQYRIFEEREYTFDGRTQPNRNRLLWIMPEATGLKTGHTQEAGYCLVGAAKQGKTRLVSAVFGTTSDTARAGQSKALLGYGLRQFETVRPSTRQLRRKVEVFHGKDDHVYLEPSRTVWTIIPKGMEKKLSFRLSYDSPVSAPIKKGQAIGVIEAVLQMGERKKILDRISMVAVREVKEASWFGRQWDELRLWWQKKDMDGNE
ncbi:MAG: D-alanyl-D-alanine carboxypeptidase family protein [Mariprofundaceae bacterium]|nr:D-alanyl-D-alanine carboxypeptidase family protein [Mariprofundaceae bacterium]